MTAKTKQAHGTGISWTHIPGYKGETWNPTVGCTRVSAGCDHCYAFALHDKRYADNLRVARETIVTMKPTVMAGAARDHGDKLPWPAQYDTPYSQVQLLPERLEQPLHWRKPRAVFVDSMTDLFHEDVPDEFIGSIFGVMSMAPAHKFMILTKRPERMWLLMRHAQFKLYVNAERLRRGVSVLPDSRKPDGTYAWPLPNVWLGVSVEDQATVDERCPVLFDTPAAVRFVSYEPALEAVEMQLDRCVCGRFMAEHSDHDLRSWLDWIIVGGESGKGRRELDIAWVASVYEQCQTAGVAYFGKQRAGARPGLPLPAPYDAKAWPA